MSVVVGCSQPHRDRGARAETRASDGDAAAVRFDEGLGDAQSDAAPAVVAVAGAGAVHAVEPVKPVEQGSRCSLALPSPVPATVYWTPRSSRLQDSVTLPPAVCARGRCRWRLRIGSPPSLEDGPRSYGWPSIRRSCLWGTAQQRPPSRSPGRCLAGGTLRVSLVSQHADRCRAGRLLGGVVLESHRHVRRSEVTGPPRAARWTGAGRRTRSGSTASSPGRWLTRECWTHQRRGRYPRRRRAPGGQGRRGCRGCEAAARARRGEWPGERRRQEIIAAAMAK